MDKKQGSSQIDDDDEEYSEIMTKVQDDLVLEADYEDESDPKPKSDIDDSIVDSSDEKLSKPEVAIHEKNSIFIDEPVQTQTIGSKKVSNTFKNDPSTRKRRSSTDSLNGKFREEVGSSAL